MPKPKKNESKQDFLKRCTSELIEQENREADQAYAMCNVFWDDNKNQRSILNLHMPVAMAKKDGDEARREFMITAYTGKPLDTWWGTVIFDLAGMKTKEKIPVLREHKRDRVVGFGNSFKADNNFYVSGEFSHATEDAKEVLALADEGYPWQASVAIWPQKIEVLENAKAKKTVNGREIQGPAEIWLESDVGEVSFVSLGRDDDTAAITLNESEGKVPVKFTNENHKNRRKIMEITLELLQQDAPELLAQIQKESRDEGFADGEAAGRDVERARVVEIINADADPIETKKAIEDGTETSAVFKQFFEAAKKKRALGLEQMETEATVPVGTEEPEEHLQTETQQKDEKTARKEWRPQIGPAAE